MENLLYVNWENVGHIIVITILTCSCLIIQLQITGKGTLAQLSSFDFSIMVALGSVLTTLLLSQGITLGNLLLSYTLLILAQSAVGWYSNRSTKTNRSKKSAPVILFYQEQFLIQAMEAEGITKEDLLRFLLQNGIGSFDEVHALIKEAGMKVSIIRKAKAASFEV